MAEPFFSQRRGSHHHPRTKRWLFYTAWPSLSSNSVRAARMRLLSIISVRSSVSFAANGHGNRVAFCNWSATACIAARSEVCPKRPGSSSGCAAFSVLLAAIPSAACPTGSTRGAGMLPQSSSRLCGGTASSRRVRAASAPVSAGPQTRHSGRVFCAGAFNC